MKSINSAAILLFLASTASAEIVGDSLEGASVISESPSNFKGSYPPNSMSDAQGWTVTGEWVDSINFTRWNIQELNGEITGKGALSFDLPDGKGGMIPFPVELSVWGSRNGDDVTINMRDLDPARNLPIPPMKLKFIDANTLQGPEGHFKRER
ncbi:hypothetical protein HFO56_23900 [Rhizobium laguerreae]|uniref:hypothetical protein n=1 Tax=Rhizobium laguerreae TaxID=1076926 RepID=UPI001C911EFF|nr:hypothetical protein [Rhizobium laguerreae]MBY3155372.1 hypothetical protein [Rhizobium laguerreae]